MSFPVLSFLFDTTHYFVLALHILGCRKLDNEIAILENGNGMVTHLTFHPFDTVIVATDEKDGIVYVCSLFSLSLSSREKFQK
jgi:hypothetical protein